jgi:hypothetical protein
MSNRRKYGRLVQELNDFNKGQGWYGGRAHVYIGMMLHDAETKTRLFHGTRDGIQCRGAKEDRPAKKQLPGAIPSVPFSRRGTSSATRRDIKEARTHAGSIAMQEVDAKIIGDLLDTNSVWFHQTEPLRSCPCTSRCRAV